MQLPAHYRIICIIGVTLVALASTSARAATPAKEPILMTITSGDGQHDFDFEIGSWRDHISRLQHPLTGSKTWVEYNGTLVVRKVWGGRANLAELESDGAAGRLEGLSLRLYNPITHQWNINWANSKDGMLTPPVYGSFNHGRGEFYGQELYDGRAILVRGVFSEVTNKTCHFEQSYSADGGKTWVVNFIEILTRGTSASTGSPTRADNSDRPATRFKS